MENYSLPEGHPHKQKGWEHICTVLVLVAEYFAVTHSVTWLAWTAGLFLWFAVRNYSRHYLRPSLFKAAIVLSIPLIIAATYYLTRDPHQISPVLQTSAPPQHIPIVETPKPQPKVKIDQHGSGAGAVGGSINTGPCSNVVVGGNNNRPSVDNCDPTPKTPDVGLRKNLSQLALDMHRFMAANPNMTMDQFRQEFGVRASKLVADFESNYRIIVPVQLRIFASLEPDYTNNPQYWSDKIAADVREVDTWIPVESTYQGFSDQQLAQAMSSEIQLISLKTETAKTRMGHPDTDIPASAVREFFYADFRKCCLFVVRDLRGAALRRIGPAYFNEREMDDFASLMATTENASVGNAAAYLPYMWAMTNSLTGHN